MGMTLIQKICIWAIPVLFAITVHEVAHGWAALKLGDKTAQVLGRLTLNPLKHIDMIGTVIVPLVLLWLGGFVFGWAKPVPVNPNNLRNRRYMALVSFAGPFSNLVMAFIWALVMKLGVYFGGHVTHAALPLVYMGQAGVLINLVLFFLNMLPIPPLDGGRIISALLPGKKAYWFDKIEPFGLIILLLLLVTNVLSLLLAPLLFGSYRAILSLFNLA
jgi:Zn-dependent protease